MGLSEHDRNVRHFWKTLKEYEIAIRDKDVVKTILLSTILHVHQHKIPRYYRRYVTILEGLCKKKETMEYKIKLPSCSDLTIEVYTDNGGGSINSDLHES